MIWLHTLKLSCTLGSIRVTAYYDADMSAMNTEVLSSHFQSTHAHHFVWSGTIIADALMSRTLLPSLAYLMSVLPVRKLVLQSFGYTLSSQDAVELVRATSNVVELELRTTSTRPNPREWWMVNMQAVKCMLQNWPVSLLT